MAFHQAVIPTPSEDLAIDVLKAAGLTPEYHPQLPSLIYASESFRRGLKPNQYVTVICDRSDADNLGEALLQVRSHELMAQRNTRCEQIFNQLLTHLSTR